MEASLNTPAPRRRNNPAERRAQILDEAIRLVARDGYYRFTIEELAQRCGVSKGGLLHHFPTKEQLLLGVLEEYDRRATTFFQSTLPRGPLAGSARLADLLQMMLAYPAREPELCRLYAVLRAEALNSAHPAHPYFREREGFVLKSLAEMVAPLVDDPEPIARQLHALMDGLILQWLACDQSFDLDWQWARALKTMLPALGSDGK